MRLSKQQNTTVGIIDLKPNLMDILKDVSDKDFKGILDEMDDPNEYWTQNQDIHFKDLMDKEFKKRYSIKQTSKYLYIDIDKFRYQAIKEGQKLSNLLFEESIPFELDFNFEESSFKIEYSVLKLNIDDDIQIMEKILKVLYIGCFR
jgi:hypothetical protein